MELLKVNISTEGKIVAMKERVSLVEDDSNLFDSQKLVSSTKDLG
jgi:fructose/tagatose bisphosphate aldolase